MKAYRIAIIGGGAAGLYLASFLARAGVTGVAVLEKNDRCGRKLNATGNGQGNLSNADLSLRHFHSSERDVLASRMGDPADPTCLSLFEALGIPLDADPSGKLYPLSRQASCLTDSLRLCAGSGGIEEICGFEVSAIRPDAEGFSLRSSAGRTIRAGIAVCCFGGAAAPSFGTDGRSYALLEALGHHRTPIAPSLVQLKTDPALPRTLKGIKVPAEVTVLAAGRPTARSRGDLLFCDYGVSGSAVFNVSGAASEALLAGREVRLSLDLLPQKDRTWLTRVLFEQRERLREYPAENFLSGVFHKTLFRMVLKHFGFRRERCGDFTDGELYKLADLFCALPLAVRGTAGFSSAQVTKGGFLLSEFDEDLQSRLVPGLYAAGELLDADGDCGGYNLHFAWLSARKIGEKLIRTLA